MNILVIGGTLFFGVPMVNELLSMGHQVTIATRGKRKDGFGDKVGRLKVERGDAASMREALQGRYFDVIIDKIAYTSNDVKYVLDYASCSKYIMMSTTSVYNPKHWDTKEEDFDAREEELIWCNRSDFPYGKGKRLAECALYSKYADINSVAVRYPFVIGEGDYTKRLLFYVEHVVKGIPMFIDNIDCQMGFIHSAEAGKFMAYLVDKDFWGAINGASGSTVSVGEILEYIEEKTGKVAILSPDGEPAPYNGEPEYSINTEKAKAIGFQFSNVKDWIYQLLDGYIGL
ncbi:MAG: reductase [Lachnospiraceae bacterium]|jgi:nucleoside-diphosphate-sugar epimerase|nr:reductase [Lachnospiraceae bacterium]